MEKNMVRKIMVLLTVLALTMALMIGGCASPAQTDVTPRPEGETIKLSYAFFAPAATFPAVQMEKWAEEVERRTNGLVQVDTFPGGSLLDAGNMWDGVTTGVAHIGLGAPSYDPGRFPLISGVSLPVGFTNSTVSSLVMWDLIQEFQPAEFADFKVITAFTGEPGYIESKNPVRNLDDLRGMELRAAGTGIPVLRALGASPVGMPMPEVPESIQTGVIEGTMTSREVLMDFNLAEMTKYVTDYPTVVVSFAAVMEKSVWDSLPADVQAVIDELGEEMAYFTGQYHDNENVKKALEWSIEEHGLEIITLAPAERAKWDELLQPLVDEWIVEAERNGLPGREFIDRLYQLRDKYSE